MFLESYVTHVIDQQGCRITNGKIKQDTQRPMYPTTYEEYDRYFKWLLKEIDDATAMQYLQVPSPDIPDDTIIVNFTTNVFAVLLGRKQWEEKVKRHFNNHRNNKKHPLCITMSICRGYENEGDVANYINNFFKLLISRVEDKTLVEIVQTADISLPDDTILVKIYGDIWKNGPLFREYPEK